MHDESQANAAMVESLVRVVNSYLVTVLGGVKKLPNLVDSWGSSATEAKRIKGQVYCIFLYPIFDKSRT